MDNLIRYDFQCFTLQELFKGRDAYKLLVELDFMMEPVELKWINEEIERRTSADIVL